MSDLHKALADIGAIRLQLAAGTLFRGFGPAVIAATGVLAIVATASQVLGLVPYSDSLGYFALWFAAAVICAGMIGFEMIARTRRQHSGLADALLFNAVEHFLPVGVAGAVIAAVILKFAPDAAWLLPGLWQMLLGVGLFAALRFLPRTVAIAAAWYFVAGAAVLMLGAQSRAMSPWMMGVPFAVGQLLLAAILHIAQGGSDGEAR